MANIKTRIEALQKDIRELKAHAQVEQAKRLDWRNAFAFLPGEIPFERFVNVVLYLNEDMSQRTDKIERFEIFISMAFWISIFREKCRDQAKQNEESVRGILQKLKGDGRLGQFMIVQKELAPKAKAINEWFKEVRALKFDGQQDPKRSAWEREREWIRFVVSNRKTILAECPIVV